LGARRSARLVGVWLAGILSSVNGMSPGSGRLGVAGARALAACLLSSGL
jgi:hypothetical protein